MFNKAVPAVLALTLLAPAAALAAHGKAGLWEATDTMTMGGMKPMSHSTTFCMTEEQVQADPLSKAGDPRCTLQNKNVSGHTFSADMICGGEHGAKGHMSTTYDSDTHYTGSMTLTLPQGSMEHKFEGHWVKADCAGAEQQH